MPKLKNPNGTFGAKIQIINFARFARNLVLILDKSWILISILEMLNNMFKMYEPAEEDEENAINVVIGPEMSKDDVVKEILNKVQAFEK